jgi:hypothetical protein
MPFPFSFVLDALALRPHHHQPVGPSIFGIQIEK